MVGGGPKARFEKNRKAIETYLDLTASGREPTALELDTIASYTGFGSFGQELFQGNWNNPSPKAGWETEDGFLRDYLGKEDWESMQRSIINAHYTDPITVETIWGMIGAMGFTGGRVLEPSVGIGNFFGLMPVHLASQSQRTGIELDRVTGGMAKLLYPNSNVQIKGYQDSKTADNFYDLVIGNWPFANITISDPRYDKLSPSLHNYFFLKALDQVRPGGLVVGITSNSTMDQKTQSVRIALARKAELVGVFRLPAGAFKQYAGTAVVTDIIILKKRAQPLSYEDALTAGWIRTESYKTPAGPEIEVNEYWGANKANILGRLNHGHGTTTGRAGMIVERPANYEAMLRGLVSRVPANVMVPWDNSGKRINYVANDTKARQNSIVAKGGKFYQVKGEHLADLSDIQKWEVKSKKETAQRAAEMKALIELRDGLMKLLFAQSTTQSDLSAQRAALKKQYDAFTNSYGPIIESGMLKVMLKAEDVTARALANLERRDATGAWVPREILTTDIVRREVSMENLTIEDAYSMDRYKNVDIDIGRIAKMSNSTEEAVIEALTAQGQIFRTPPGAWQARDQYLAGNVRQKLREALDAKDQGVEGMERNVEALKAIVPKDIPYTQIDAQLGATWVLNTHYKQFIQRLLGLNDQDLQHIDIATSNIRGFKLDFKRDYLVNRPEATTQWGTAHISWRKVIDAAFNNGSVVIKVPDENGNPVTDPELTRKAMEKVTAIREEFKEWIWKDPARAIALQNIYNETLNSHVEPNWDGSHLRLVGLSLNLGANAFDLRAHQKSAVWRFMVQGRGVGAHEVGTGKTFTIAALAIEGRRLGTFRKPLIMAHNANSASIAEDIQLAYPGARVLYVDNLSKSNRDAALQQIALDEWDAVVMPHSLLNRLALREETMMAQARELILELENEAIQAAAEEGITLTVEDMNSGKYKEVFQKARAGATAKELVKQRERIIERIKKSAQAMTDDAVFFEDMGIDSVIVDEAHIFKKIPIATRQKLKGLNKNGSERSVLLSMLTDYVKSKQGGKGVFMFTGTPITNTVNEAYNMMRYVMSDTMERDGVKRWDGWFNAFAEGVTDVELTGGGTWEPVERLSQFVNVPELARFAAQTFDVVYAKDMPEFKPRSSQEGRDESGLGRPFRKKVDVVVQMSALQKEHLEDVQSRAEQFRKADGRTKRDWMLAGDRRSPIVYEGEGVKASLDYRLLDMSAPDHPGSKVNAMIERAMEHYREHPKSTQMIFMDRGYYSSVTRTVKQQDGTRTTFKVPTFNLAQDIIDKLVSRGVPPEQIVVFPWLSNEKRKEAAAAMRNGEVRFAIGGTETMGTGVNAQTELRAMHHLDAPWMPGELEQRNGRGWRQGNRWNSVYDFRYFAEGSHDGRRWQILLTKDKFQRRFMEAVYKKGEIGIRIIDGDGADLSEDQTEGDQDTSFGDSFAAAVGDPRVIMREKLRRKIETVERKKVMFVGQQRDAANEIEKQRAEIERRLRAISLLEGDIAHYEKNKPDPFSIKIGEKSFADRKSADTELADFEKAYPKGRTTVEKVGDFAGYKIHFGRGDATEPYWTVGRGETRNIYRDKQFNGTAASLEANLRGLVRDKDNFLLKNLEAERGIANLETLLNSTFSRQAQLDGLVRQFDQLEAELRSSPTPPPSWLRLGAPVGSMVMWKGKPYDVSAHRWDAKNWWLLVTDPNDESGQLIPVPYNQVSDADGQQIFESRIFETPPNARRAAGEQRKGPEKTPGGLRRDELVELNPDSDDFDTAPPLGQSPLWRIHEIKPDPDKSDNDSLWTAEIRNATDEKNVKIVGVLDLVKADPAKVEALKATTAELSKPVEQPQADLPLDDAAKRPPRRSRLRRLADDMQAQMERLGELQDDATDKSEVNELKARAASLQTRMDKVIAALAQEESAGLKRARDNGELLGAPSENNAPPSEPPPEKEPLPSSLINKPAPVPDRPGWFFRSEPDSLRALGYSVSRQVYERRPQATANEQALEILSLVDEDKATDLALDPNENGIPGDVKTILYGELMARQAKIVGDPNSSALQRAKAQRRLQQMDDVKAPQFTAKGQEISALQQVYKNASAGGIAQYIHQKKKEQEIALGGEKGMADIKAAADELTKVNEQSIEEATRAMNKALRALPLTKPIWKKYKDWAAQRVFDWLDGVTKPPQEMAGLERFTREIVDQVKSRMKEEMGDAAKAQKLAERNPSDILRDAILNKEKYREVFDNVLKKLEAEYGEDHPLVEQAHIALGAMGAKPWSKGILDKVIKQAHEAMGQNVRELAKLHYTNANRLHRDLADALSDIAGIGAPTAKELADDLAKRMQELTAEAKKKAILGIVRRNTATPKTREKMTAIERAVLLNNYGALSVPELADVVAKELKLPHISPEQMKEIARIGDRIETATNMADKAKAELDMVRTLRIARGISRMDVNTSVWYANMLSGYTTQGGNVSGNMMTGTLQLATIMATNPKYAGEALRGWINGFGEGWAQGAAIVKSGRGSREFDANKAGEAGNVLELVDFKRDFPDMNKKWANARQKHTNALRYVTRFMKAVDSVFYYPAREAFARVAVAKLLEGKFKGKELIDKVRETLAISPDQFVAATKRAEAEGFTGIDLVLRTANIIEEARRVAARKFDDAAGTSERAMDKALDASEQFALESTLNNEPVGWAGILYQHLVPLTQSITPGGVPVLRIFMPFLRVPTNLFNMSMNFTPVGALRARRGMPTQAIRGVDGKMDVERHNFTAEERKRLYAQSIGGSLAMAGLAVLAMSGGDDGEEPWFDITSTGPDDYKKRQQLEATGWRPHSIKMGDTWVSYKDSPLLIALAVTGHVVDAVRYGKQDDEVALGSKVANAFLTAPRAIMETSMLSGLGQLMEYASGRASAKQLTSFLTRTATGVAVPNLLQQLDRQFSPEVRESNGPLGTVGAGLPFVRRAGDVKTDVLGEAVERSPLARFGGFETNDPLREVLRDKGVFISTPSRDTKLGNAPMDEETYREYVRISGERIQQRLSQSVRTLQAQSKENVERIVDRITREERERAKNMLRGRAGAN